MEDSQVKYMKVVTLGYFELNELEEEVKYKLNKNWNSSLSIKLYLKIF